MTPADRLAVIDTVNKYGWSYDSKDLHAIEEMLASHATWIVTVAGIEQSHAQGRDRILAWLERGMTTTHELKRHSLSNAHFVETTAVSAQVRAYMTVIQVIEGVASLMTTAVFDFTFSRDAQTWRIVEVRADFDV